MERHRSQMRCDLQRLWRDLDSGGVSKTLHTAVEKFHWFKTTLGCVAAMIWPRLQLLSTNIGIAYTDRVLVEAIFLRVTIVL